MKKRPLSPQQIWLHRLIHLLVWLPLLWLLWGYWQNSLGFNPIHTITLRTGKGALVLLLLSLACTPLNILFGWSWVFPVRRLLGLYAFLYAAIHFLIFIGLDYGFDLTLVADALWTNQYTQVGLVAFIILIPLALSSTHHSIAWMGYRRWKLLHRLSYLAAILAIVHYAMLVRQHYTQPIIFAVILTVLFGIRLVSTAVKSRRLQNS
jgi:methionine sulfoxide reductase heme-binding subunit